VATIMRKSRFKSACMEAIKQLALELLETEKRYLLEDKSEYSAAIVVVITPEGRYWEEVTFDDEDQKVEAYAAVVARKGSECHSDNHNKHGPSARLGRW
jgi:hypothetical protein